MRKSILGLGALLLSVWACVGARALTPPQLLGISVLCPASDECLYRGEDLFLDI